MIVPVFLCRELFQRGCLDVFILKGMPDVRPFTHLIIGHDGAGPHPGAHIPCAPQRLHTGGPALGHQLTNLQQSSADSKLQPFMHHAV